MSRLNPQRSIGGEHNLARRIEFERTERGWSYEALAKKMTDAGCSIQASAIYKIEKMDPPRRITVDELIALAQVFRTTVENLLTPIDVLQKERAHQLLAELDEADMDLHLAASGVVVKHRELFKLAADDPELFEYVKNLRDWAKSFSATIVPPSSGRVRVIESRKREEGYKAFYEGLMDLAQQMAELDLKDRDDERAERSS
jgi:transcriptional regulator with XRE-family HTH domain